MIAFGICISDRAKYERVVRPCLDRCIEPDSRVIELEHQTSIFDAYNRILVAAAADPDLEGLVLLHDDLEILDHEICERLRVLFRDTSIAVAGVIGARNPRTLAWWHYETLGYVRERHLPSGVVTENRGNPSSGTHDVDTVDGIFLALSPLAVRSLRFDARSFRGFDGYDADICAQARAAGMRVVIVDIEVVHNRRTETVYRDYGAFRRSDFTWRSKWLDAPRWKRLSWRSRAYLAVLEVRVRRWSWVRHCERFARLLASRTRGRPRS
jgi:hypothetical protein